MAIALRDDYDAARLRQAARDSDDADQVRRLLALAAIYDGATRAEAAQIGGVTRQIVRDWVLRFNDGGRDAPDQSQGARQGAAARCGRARSIGGGDRGRADAGRR